MTQHEKVPHNELSASELHALSLEQNERGMFLDALLNCDKALYGYDREGNSTKSAEIRALRTLLLRRMYKETGIRTFIIDAKHQAMSAVEIARENREESGLSIPLFQLGKVQIEAGDNAGAIGSYEEALKLLPKSPHNRKGVEADIRANLETVKLVVGDATAEERAIAAIGEIQTADDANEHEKGVWAAGGYMRLAEAVSRSDAPRAAQYLDKAGEIINQNPEDLKVIKGDFDRLSSQFQ